MSNDGSQRSTNPKEEDIRESLNPLDTVHILFPLSREVLRLVEDVFKTAEPLPNILSQRLFEVMQASEVPWKAPLALHKMVFKSAANIVVKAVRDMDDYTEYTTLQYLEQHIPDCPAPRPLGCMWMSGISLIFLTHKPLTSLGEVWHGLDSDQKASVRDQLEDTLIKTLGEFEDFLFSSSRPGSLVFMELLRQLSPCLSSPPNIVFTHGDLQPDNIMVEIVNCNWYVITSLLDWEYSGFYPDYYEAVRCTNCLSSCKDNDWFLFFPDCISPKRYTHWWLLDRVRETRSMWHQNKIYSLNVLRSQSSARYLLLERNSTWVMESGLTTMPIALIHRWTNHWDLGLPGLINFAYTALAMALLLFLLSRARNSR